MVEILEGHTIGYLTVLHKVPGSLTKKAGWLCKCECGKEKFIPTHSLTGTAGAVTKSCGCKRYEMRNKTNKLNGFTPGKYERKNMNTV